MLHLTPVTLLHDGFGRAVRQWTWVCSSGRYLRLGICSSSQLEDLGFRILYICLSKNLLGKNPQWKVI